MTFFQFAAPQPGQKYDYPTLGFFAVNGAILDGTASNPQITAAPDAHWTVVASGPESGITRYRQPQTPPDDQSSWDGSLLVYDASTRAFVRKAPSDAIASGTGLGQALDTAYASRYSDSKLAPFQAALAKRAMAPVDILCVGDSVTEGLYASKYAQRWVRRLAGSLRGRFPVSGVTGGDGYVPIWVTNGTYTDYPVTIGGTMATSASYGLGLRARQMGGSGASVTLTFTGTAFDFFYVKYSGGGSFTVKVDGGTAVQVNTTNATTIGGQRYSVTGLTAGSHTVVVNWVSGICFFEGFMLYNGDENAGVRVWDSGHSSYRAGNFDGTSNPHWIDAVSAIQPALVVLEFGINDWEQNITPAAFQTSLQAIISNVRALCTTPPLFALFKCWVANVGGTPTYKWTDYTAIMDQIAAGDDHVVVFDAWERLTQGSATAVRGPAPWLDGDTIHPNDAGHGFIADCLTDFLTPH